MCIILKGCFRNKYAASFRVNLIVKSPRLCLCFCHSSQIFLNSIRHASACRNAMVYKKRVEYLSWIKIRGNQKLGKFILGQLSWHDLTWRTTEASLSKLNIFSQILSKVLLLNRFNILWYFEKLLVNLIQYWNCTKIGNL